MQRLQELEQTVKHERHKYNLKLLALQKEREIDNQRLEQELKLKEQEIEIREETSRYQQRLPRLMKRTPQHQLEIHHRAFPLECQAFLIPQWYCLKP